jgi:hypothetical protein
MDEVGRLILSIERESKMFFLILLVVKIDLRDFSWMAGTSFIRHLDRRIVLLTSLAEVV